MLRWLSCSVVLLWSSVISLSAVAQAQESAAKSVTPSRAAWMAQGTYGVMTHYLIRPKGNTPEERTAELNRIVDQFDVDFFVQQFQATGADWLIFTLGQTTGYLCSPNPVVDAKNPGRTPRRDVALEIAKRLKPLGKRMILYFPSVWDLACKETLGCDGKDNKEYEACYFEFLKQYSLKFGKLHDGWWFDACAPQPDEFYQKWLSAVRAGNSEAAVAFSGAEFCTGGPVNPICKLADYHAGEIHLLEDGKIRRDFLPPGGDIVVVDGKLRKRGQEARYYLPDGPAIDNIQWHGLLPIDLTFNPAVPNQFCHYTDKELQEFVRRVKAVGGAITINVPIEIENGHIPVDSHAQLVRLSKAMDAIAPSGQGVSGR